MYMRRPASDWQTGKLARHDDIRSRVCDIDFRPPAETVRSEWRDDLLKDSVVFVHGILQRIIMGVRPFATLPSMPDYMSSLYSVATVGN